MSYGPQILTPSYYSRLFELEQVHGWCTGMRTLAAALLDPIFRSRTHWRVLDAGCGTGGMADWLRRYPGTDVVGIDLSEDALGFCQRRGQRALVLGSVCELPFVDQSFDFVLSTDVLQHVVDPPGDVATLREALRVLRPGGYLYLRTNSRFGLGPQVREANYRRYTRPELLDRFAQAGFAVERATYANSLPSLLAIAQSRLRRRTASAQAMDLGLRLKPRPRGLRWIDHGLASVLAAEAWYVQSRQRDLPFGHSLVVLARRPENG
jgi:SAM-dependent methyltransferase